MRLTVLGLALVGCGGEGTVDGGVLTVTDANNYTYSADITIGSVTVAPQTDVAIDWSSLTVDLRGRDVVADDIREVTLIEFTTLSQAEVEAQIENNQLRSESGELPFQTSPSTGEDSVLVSELMLAGGFDPMDLAADSGSEWLLSISSFEKGQRDPRQLLWMTPTADETADVVAFENDISTLEVTVGLDGEPIPAAAGLADIEMNWSGVTLDASGEAFDNLVGDELLIARFDVDSTDDIVDSFLELDTAAAEIYRVNVFGLSSASLGDAVDCDGNAFDGFTTEGIWLVGVSCVEVCANPVPLILSVVDVQP